MGAHTGEWCRGDSLVLLPVRRPHHYLATCEQGHHPHLNNSPAGLWRSGIGGTVADTIPVCRICGVDPSPCLLHNHHRHCGANANTGGGSEEEAIPAHRGQERSEGCAPKVTYILERLVQPQKILHDELRNCIDPMLNFRLVVGGRVYGVLSVLWGGQRVRKTLLRRSTILHACGSRGSP